MGWSVFEEICGQWLQRNAQQRLGLNVREMARYWSRDGRTEIDLMAELDSGSFLFGECKWRTERITRLGDERIASKGCQPTRGALAEQTQLHTLCVGRLFPGTTATSCRSSRTAFPDHGHGY